MVNKPTILLTNDDGVYAKGLNELIRSLKGFANLIVVAPDGPRSGMSSSITSAVPIKYKLLRKEEGLVVYSCTGTPVDCVKLAMNEILQCKPDLLLSGINHGTNVAICVHYSGTIGAAIEGCVFKVPSVGISLTSHSPDADFSESCRISRMVIEKILKFGLPDGTYLNLNVPYIRDVKGVRVCSQASGKWVNEFMCSSNASGEPVFWLTGNFEEEKPDHPENDTLALEQGFASLVPCRIDVTNYDFMERLKEQWF